MVVGTLLLPSVLLAALVPNQHTGASTLSSSDSTIHLEQRSSQRNQGTKVITTFVDFSASGSYKITDWMRQLNKATGLDWYDVPTHMDPHLGCAAGKEHQPRGITTDFPELITGHYSYTTKQECPCQDLKEVAEKNNVNWLAQANPVMMPSGCHDFGLAVRYWTVMRHPIDRLLTRMFTSPRDGSHKLQFMSIEEMKLALTNDTEFTPRRNDRAEFTGSAALNNWYVRSLSFPRIFQKKLGEITRVHELEAWTRLQRFELVLPVTHILDMPEAVARLHGNPCIERLLDDQIDLPGLAWHEEQKTRATRDNELMQLLKRHNSHDISLYWRVWHLHQERMAVYRKLAVNKACAQKLEDLKLRAGLAARPEFEAEVANLDEIEDLI